MIRRIFLILGIVLLMIPIGFSQANAYLMGQTLTAEWLYPDTSTVIATYTINVGSGVELPVVVPPFEPQLVVGRHQLPDLAVTALLVAHCYHHSQGCSQMPVPRL